MSAPPGLPLVPLQVCHLDCQEPQGLNATQLRWLHPPYDVSSSLQRLPLGTKVGASPAAGLRQQAGRGRPWLGHGHGPASHHLACTAPQAPAVGPTCPCAQAMSVLASHHDGSVQYNTHQLYGLSAVLTISRAVRAILGRRPFVLSRSSFLGTGAYAAHWTGDNSGGAGARFAVACCRLLSRAVACR